VKPRVCILDYGSGNVGSVHNIISFMKYDVTVSNRAEDITGSTHVVLPGVGAFGAAMEKIRAAIPVDVLFDEVVRKKKPFLGICVGMQVLAEKGYEHGEFEGLGWIKGSVKRLEAKDVPLPHVGWNDLDIKAGCPLFKNFGAIRDFYFVHSFALETAEPSDIASETDYGGRFCSSVQKENIFGVQFHPEKSQKAGQLLLKNFFDHT
jgi:glutamine amidotransferase